MTLPPGLVLTVPPSPAEWRDMENTHLFLPCSAHAEDAARAGKGQRTLARVL
jgi:hypothetical protein